MHGIDRARCRGTRQLQVQLLLAATAINLKRLLTRPAAAQNAAAGDGTVARRHLQTIRACLDWLRRNEPASSVTGS